jgi:acyl-CoA-binding protein
MPSTSRYCAVTITVEAIFDVCTVQGSVGDINTDRPGMLDFTGKVCSATHLSSLCSRYLHSVELHQAKWDAWNALKGK